ncbi:DUF554 domain-containing protein [Clostridium swellfunianum]|uniref:DUF554 domain-containing protein n=1 Tax=Clostridium swellfunianum TaxID=1367462 RepID=UPI00202EC8A1|nr:DUF554 domain-containing protein [Clostridium swellfunianum]MCM0650784.1 DUF554 domain-containing protein [Clostridium swellfunianum]
MLGTVVNSLAIIVGSLAGFVLKGGIPERINDSIMKGLALCIMVIGITGAIKSDNMILVICSIVIGTIIGELVDIDKWLKRLGDLIETKLQGRGGKVSEGFVTASLVYCVGAMAIVGSLNSGLKGDHEILFTKAMLDGISSIMFTSTLGIGVTLSAVSVFIYQGLITVGASFIQGVLTQPVVTEISAVGSLLIIGLGFNMMGLTKIKVANLLPAILIPIGYFTLYVPIASSLGKYFYMLF